MNVTTEVRRVVGGGWKAGGRAGNQMGQFSAICEPSQSIGIKSLKQMFLIALIA
jgi:hypothetical protein